MLLLSFLLRLLLQIIQSLLKRSVCREQIFDISLQRFRPFLQFNNLDSVLLDLCRNLGQGAFADVALPGARAGRLREVVDHLHRRWFHLGT